MIVHGSRRVHYASDHLPVVTSFNFVNYTGIEEADNRNSLIDYTSPFVSNLSMRLPLGHSYKSITVSNLLGHRLATINTEGKEQLNWDSGQAPKGVYIVNAMGENETHSFKVVKH